jgi:hypothetical protein
LLSRRLLNNILRHKIKAPVESGAYFHSIILLVTGFYRFLTFRVPIGFIGDRFLQILAFPGANRLYW